MSLKEIEEIEAVMRTEPRRYHRDAAMQARYRALLTETPQFRMSKADLQRAVNEHDAADKVAARTPLAAMSDDDLLAHREKWLAHRDKGEAYRRLIADQEERDARPAGDSR